MHPVDIDSAELVREAHQARRREKKRVVKRRVAGDPDDKIDTIDQRSVEDVLSEEQSFDEARAPNPNRGLMLATIAMGVVALIMVVWLLWPARAPARPRLPAREAATDAVPAASKLSAAQNAPEVVKVQFRAAKSTEIYVDGTQVMPGEVRAVKPGPLSVGYRCASVKKGQRSRDLTFNTRVPAEGVQPFLIDLSCR